MKLYLYHCQEANDIKLGLLVPVTYNRNKHEAIPSQQGTAQISFLQFPCNPF